MFAQSVTCGISPYFFRYKYNKENGQRHKKRLAENMVVKGGTKKAFTTRSFSLLQRENVMVFQKQEVHSLSSAMHVI